VELFEHFVKQNYVANTARGFEKCQFGVNEARWHARGGIVAPLTTILHSSRNHSFKNEESKGENAGSRRVLVVSKGEFGGWLVFVKEIN